MRVSDVTIEYRHDPIGIGERHPRISWRLVGTDRRFHVMQDSYQLQVAEDPDFETIIWDTERVKDDISILVPYKGPELRSRTTYYCRVRVWDRDGNVTPWSETACWEMSILSSGEWSAQWISHPARPEDERQIPAHYFRKTFHVRSKPKRARAYVASLGFYLLYLNHEKVGDDWFAPGWTSYRRRLQVQTYDVTDRVRTGENALGAILANGWYKGALGWENKQNHYGDERGLLLQLHMEYEDGSEETVVTDGSWYVTDKGPIRFAEIYHGETYDARMELDGWAGTEYEQTAVWQPVKILEQGKHMLIARESEPVRVIREIRPVSVLKTPNGQTVLDFGQNMVGRVAFSVQAQSGTKITLRHAEVLDREGNIYFANLRSARQTVVYICRGGEKETYAPHFTFQGFRYVLVEGWPGKMRPESFSGQVMHSDLRPTGTFSCSDPLVNRLQQNIVWSQKGNFLDVPTDCPQRDERLGWTGDAQVFFRTAAFNMQVAPFFRKWLRDLKADQRADGGVPWVIPHVLGEDQHSAAAWGDAAVIIPWLMYVTYGDRRILEEQFDSMKAWIEYVRKQGDNEFLWNTGFHFGDWLGLDAQEGSYTGSTLKDFIATAFYAHSASLVAKAAKVLGKRDDAEKYEQLRNEIAAHFNREFVTPNGRLAAPTQTACVLAVMFGLVDGKARERALAMLENDIRESGGQLKTGFVGTPYLCHVLSENGLNDLAYELLLRKEYPSWLYPVLRGATTIWEHWDGIRPDGTFWDDHMNSFNHYAYGSIGDWLYRVVAGINPVEERPGYKHIRIAPRPADGLTHAEATLDSMYGRIHSSWRRKTEGNHCPVMEMAVRIPPNTTATIALPGAQAERVTLDGKPLREANHIFSYWQDKEFLQIETGSGIYHFTYSPG